MVCVTLVGLPLLYGSQCKNLAIKSLFSVQIPKYTGAQIIALLELLNFNWALYHIK